MKIVRYTLAGCSAVCLTLILVSSFFFGYGLNPIALILMLFFGTNAVYLFFLHELSQPSRLLKTLAGYFAFTALELEYRAKVAEKNEEIKSEESASKFQEDTSYRNDRLKAAEDFLRLITVGSPKTSSTINPDIKQISNNKDESAAIAPKPALALTSRAQGSMNPGNGTTTSIKMVPPISLAVDLEPNRTRLNS